jgi:formylglycine-generating enzyme required for sulfatase activity
METSRTPSPDDPPPHLVAKYGPPPAGGPTGRRKTVAGIEFIELKPGYFLMGSEENETERPRHWVEIAYSFWIAKTEVTVAQYEEFDHQRSVAMKLPDLSAVHVNWDDARAFCRWLTKQAPGSFRLPSEAEWECACRAGTTTQFWFGDQLSGLPACEWFEGNVGGTYFKPGTQRVATRRANPWGLHDMAGNVREWCEDHYYDSYQGAPKNGSAWHHESTATGRRQPRSLRTRVVRGGSWGSSGKSCRSASRGRFPRHARWMELGFRPVALLPD